MKGRGETLNSLLESAVVRNGFQGTALVVEKGKMILKNGYGRAHLDDIQPMTVNTRFPVGSVTKPITALAILHLIERGKFVDKKTDDPIYDPSAIQILDFLPPHLQPDPSVKDQWEKVTLLDLLNHTSGLPGYPERGKLLWEAKGKKWSTPLSPDTVLDMVRGEELKSFGEYNYSNFGYHLLGKIIEHVGGKPYEQFMNAFLQENLKLENTGYVEPLARYPDVFTLKRSERQVRLPDSDDVDPPTEGYSSGGLYSTVENLQKLLMLMMDGKIISKSHVERFILHPDRGSLPRKPAPDFRDEFQCSCGWNHSGEQDSFSQWEGSHEIWKTGAIGFYGSLVVLYPEEDSAIIVLSNKADEIEPITENLTHALFLPNPDDNDVESSWNGIFRFAGQAWSIAKTGDGYVMRHNKEGRKEYSVEFTKNNDEASWNWGALGKHTLKKIGGNYVLLDGEGYPVPVIVERILYNADGKYK